MEKTIKGEKPVQILAHNVTIGPSSSGYQLQFSADGTNFQSDTDAVVPANETLRYLGISWGEYIRLSGNTDDVKITF